MAYMDNMDLMASVQKRPINLISQSINQSIFRLHGIMLIRDLVKIFKKSHF